MDHNLASPPGHGWNARADHGGVIVTLTGDWLASAGGLAEQGVVQKIVATGGKGVSFDARELGGWDSTLLVFIESLRHAARERGVPFDDTGLPPAASRLLALAAEAAPLKSTSSRTAL
jgi:anti-anti-sigma regulatory factor